MNSEVLGVDVGLLTAAHELKSPLSLLRQLALSLDLVQNPAQISSQMITISERALSQIDDLLKIARLENGLFELEPVNPRTICDSLNADLNFAKQIRITYRNRRRLAIANRQLLHSIISNFITNAIKYGDEAQLAIYDHADTIRISVRDFGPALPISIWRTINTNSLESPLPTPLRPGSSGLGLFIASRFARHMHATLGAIRHRDGTSFYLDLPLSRQLTLC